MTEAFSFEECPDEPVPVKPDLRAVEGNKDERVMSGLDMMHILLRETAVLDYRGGNGPVRRRVENGYVTRDPGSHIWYIAPIVEEAKDT